MKRLGDVRAPVFNSDPNPHREMRREEMVKNEWTLLEDISVIMGDVAMMQYDKPQRTAIVTISKDTASGQTYVQVLIQPK